jgi:hypothetical protein
VISDAPILKFSDNPIFKGRYWSMPLRHSQMTIGLTVENSSYKLYELRVANHALTHTIHVYIDNILAIYVEFISLHASHRVVLQIDIKNIP